MLGRVSTMNVFRTSPLFVLTLIAGSWLVTPSLHGAERDTRRTVAHQSIDREYIVYSPASSPNGPAPVVLSLQGKGQPIDNLRQSLRLDRVADEHGFRVVYPVAVNDVWSYRRPVVNPMPSINGQTIDDLGFIKKVIEEIVAQKLADPRRVYATGVSRGGLMSFTLACSIPDKIAAIAPIIASMTEHQIADCGVERALPVVVVAGTNDINIRYDGWIFQRGRVASVAETMEFWRKSNGCTGQTIQLLPDLDPTDLTRIALKNWTGCRADTVTRLYKVWGGGHRVPVYEPNQVNPRSRRNRRSGDMETAEILWTVFKEISLP